LVEHPRDVLRVVLDAEVLPNPLAYERPRPDPRPEARSHRPSLDDARELQPLVECEAWGATGRDPRTQPLDAIGLVPCQPLRRCRPMHAELSRECGDWLPPEVPKDATSPSPHIQVLGGFRLPYELLQGTDLRDRPPPLTNRLTVTRTSHGDRRHHGWLRMERTMEPQLREAV
jgi:hypothetical protein